MQLSIKGRSILMTNQEIIDEVMDFMDFDKIHRVMEFLDWKWAMSDSELRIPEVFEIRRFLRSLLNQFINENLRTLEQGGFRISKVKYEDESIIKVDFVIETLEINI